MEAVELQIVRRAQNGDRLAFGELIELYKDRLFNLAYRILGNRTDAEDILQDTFMKVYVHLNSYQADYKFSTWIYRIATNACIDRLRKRKSDLSLDEESETSEGTEGTDLYARIASLGMSTEDSAIRNETHFEIRQAMESLPPSYRSVILLRYVHELSLQEISEAVNLPVSTVKTRIHRGREALRAVLIKANQNELEV